MLDVLEVTKTYHGIAAVRSLTLTAAPGEVIGLLGPNGSGKTTTVKMIVGVNASMLVMFTAAVLPIGVVTLIVAAPRWPGADVALVVLLQMLAGVLLSECLLFRWAKVPFACAHVPSPNVLKAWWPLYAVAMYLYAFKLSDWQFAALQSNLALLSYVTACVVTIGVMRLVRRRDVHRRELDFEATHDSVERLNLSEALN